MSQFTPTDEQKRALDGPAPLLAIAGAGTGKTTVLTRRIAKIIIGGQARPEQVLALTFTDKAAAEMAERLSGVLGEHGLADKGREAAVGTFHSFGKTIIAENLLRLGFDQSPAVLSAAAAWQLMDTIFDDLTFDAVEISTGQVASVFDHLLHFISECKDHLVDPEGLERHVAGDISALSPLVSAYLQDQFAKLRDLAAAYRRYESAKKKKGLVDFGDLLLLPVQLFRRHPEIRDAYRRRFPYIFVDEYQDTNHAQRALLLELIDPARPRVMVIGDDDQAIYRWRGAVVHNIIDFPAEKIFAPNQVTLAPITENRRSYPPILDLANRAIAGVQPRHAKKLDYHPENREGRATVGHFVAASDVAEGHLVAAKIRELEPPARAFSGKKVGYGAFAVLCRRRSLFEAVGQALEESDIPYELVGGTGFYRRWEIRDILSYLRVIARPADDLATARLLLSRRLRLSSREMFHLGRWVRQQNGDRGREGERREGEARFHFLDALLNYERVDGLSPEARDRLAGLRRELEGYAKERHRLSLSDLVALVVENTGYRRELEARTGFDARVALLNLAKLEQMARDFEQGEEGVNGADLAGFVEFVGYALESGEEEGEVRPIDEETDTVKVMTVHQAKGLEFPIVFIPGLAERVFPGKPRYEADNWWVLPWDLRGDREHLPGLDLATIKTDKDLKIAQEARKEAEKSLQMDEERRLFYVAITRAQYQLYFSRAHWYGTTAKPRPPSDFWDLVVDSGVSQDLGEEECPAANPNLDSRAAGAVLADEADQAKRNDLEALLMPGGDPAAWIEATVRQENTRPYSLGGRGEVPSPEGLPSPGADPTRGLGTPARKPGPYPRILNGYENASRWRSLKAEVDAHLESLWSGTRLPREAEKPAVTCSELVQYLACPRGYRYVYVDGLPVRPSPRAAIGREVHRRIEEHSRSGPPPAKDPIREESPDEDDFRGRDDALEEMMDTRSERIGVDDLMARFRQSAYGLRPATFVEVPFHLPLQGGALRGRIDRLDRLPDGKWELVDFKTGASDSPGRAHFKRQLSLYSLALRDSWKAPAEHTVAHIFFLRDGRDLTLTFGDADLDRVRAEAETAIRRIAGAEFPMTTDRDLCQKCSYRHLCDDPDSGR